MINTYEAYMTETPQIIVKYGNNNNIETSLLCNEACQVENLTASLLRAAMTQPSFGIMTALKVTAVAIYHHIKDVMQSYNVH